jgi:glycosyltransferase involved in cell wall biosynthesis
MKAGEVLHVAKATGIGGSERHLAELLPGLRAAGVPARLYLLEEPAQPVDELVEDLRDSHVPVDRGSIRGPLDPFAVARIARAARSAAIVHTHLVHADLHGGAAVAAMGADRPAHVLSVHSERHEDGRLTRLAMGRVIKRADACIPISEAAAETARSLWAARAEQITVVPYGVRIPTGLAHVPSEEFRLVVHSRLAPKKHIDSVVRAFAQAGIPDGRLTVIGEGAHRPEIEAAIRETGLDARAELVGEVADVWPLLFAGDAWISLSSTEGFGLALAEALGAGLPSICTDIPAHREVARDAACYVPPGDVKAAAAAIRRLHDSNSVRADLAERGRRRAVKLSVEQMIERIASVYERVGCDAS